MPTAMRPSPFCRALLAVTLCTALGGPAVSNAAALGDASVRSALGQPLDADIEFAALSAAEADSLAVRIAPAELFTEAGVDYTALVRSMRVSVESRGGRRLIRVNSELPVNDPFVTLLIELNTNGSRLVRQYSLLIDPPAMDAPSSRSTAAAMQPSVATPFPPSSSPVGEAPAPASAPVTVTVRRGQTLRSIAASVQPEGVRLEQVLLALQAANPGAFVGRNINRVMSGTVLQVPDADAMRAVDAAEARRSIRVQTRDFLRYQKALAERASGQPTAPAPSDGATEAPANRSSSGRVGVQLAEAGQSSEQRDRLTLSTPSATDQPAAFPGGADSLDKIATDRALADANARIAALEKSISDMQRLLTLQNPGLADAGQADGAAASQSPATDVSEASPADSVAEPVAAAVPPTAAEADTTNRALQVPELAGEPTPAVIAAPVETPAIASPTWQERLQDPWVRGALAAVLLLPGLGWLVWRRRRHQAAADEAARSQQASAAGVDLPNMIAESGGRQVDTANSVFHSNFVPSVSQIDAKEVDALAEADVYIAYNRDAQAEEILLDALRAHPERNALRVKLLEIYAARRDHVQFGTLADDLRVRTRGEGEDWSQAVRLGQIFEPDNPLYAPASRPAVPPTDPRPAAVVDPARMNSPAMDFELRLDGLLNERGQDVVTPPVMAPSPATTPDFGLSGITQREAGTRSRIEPQLEDNNDAAALATKLELAIACQEIGDREGARELLNEVAGTRHPELAERARSLLKQLA